MAYPGVFMLDDASIFRALLRTGKNGGTICMHAENGGVIDVLVKRALARGQDGAEVPRADAAGARRGARRPTGRSRSRRWPTCPIYIVHLSAAEALEMVTEARDRGLPAYAETCPQYLFLSYDNYEEPGFDGAKYVMSPPLRPQGHAGSAVARAGVQRSAGDLDRPLPVLHEGTEGARARATSRRFRTARPASKRA